MQATVAHYLPRIDLDERAGRRLGAGPAALVVRRQVGPPPGAERVAAGVGAGEPRQL